MGFDQSLNACWELERATRDRPRTGVSWSDLYALLDSPSAVFGPGGSQRVRAVFSQSERGGGALKRLGAVLSARDTRGPTGPIFLFCFVLRLTHFLSRLG